MHSCLLRFGLSMSRFISEPFAYCASQQFFGSLKILHAVGLAVIVPEIKLGEVTA